MISRLKKKFIILTAVSLFALLVLIVAGMNIISFVSLINESDDILSVMSESGGRFPEIKEGRPDNGGEEKKMIDMPRRFSPEMQFEIRYFSVVLAENEDVVRVDTGKIAAVDTSSAEIYAKKALGSGKDAVLRYGEDNGFGSGYRYRIIKDGGNYLITFLDVTRKLDSFKTFLYSSILVSFSGFVIVLIIIVIISGRIIRPIAESYQKQKRFITDASHELKTPIAIIDANIDLIEDDVTDRESIEDIKTQTKRLKNLTDDLVTLTRMEEGSEVIVKEEFIASDTAKDISAGFKAPAEGKGVCFSAEIEPDIKIKGDRKAFEKLISILLDNAVKYTPVGGDIEFKFSKQGKSAIVTCENTTDTVITKENTMHIFDRFYRTDASRNSAAGGHGIGLSVAKAITQAHGGKITAQVPETYKFIIRCNLPMQNQIKR